MSRAEEERAETILQVAMGKNAKCALCGKWFDDPEPAGSLVWAGHWFCSRACFSEGKRRWAKFYVDSEEYAKALRIWQPKSPQDCWLGVHPKTTR